MSKPNVQSVTYCTGYWHLPGNTKRSPEHYRERLPKTLRMIRGSEMVVFHDDPAVLAMFQSAALDADVAVTGQRIALADLPAYRHGPALLACCKSMDPARFQFDYPDPGKEKAVNHYLRDYLKSGEESYMGLMTIWMSKVHLVTRTIDLRKSDDSGFLAWIDTSVSRFNRLRANWDFAKVPFGASSIHHYGTSTHFMGEKLGVNASFLVAHVNVWPKILALFESELVASLKDQYAHDEETLLHRIRLKQPHLFTRIGGKYQGPRMLSGRLLRKWHGD